MATVFFNYNSEDIVSEKIVGYDCAFESENTKTICHLYSFVEVTIRHPSAPVATLTTIEKRSIAKEVLTSSNKLKPAMFLLAEAIQNLKNLKDHKIEQKGH